MCHHLQVSSCSKTGFQGINSAETEELNPSSHNIFEFNEDDLSMLSLPQYIRL